MVHESEAKGEDKGSVESVYPHIVEMGAFSLLELRFPLSLL